MTSQLSKNYAALVAANAAWEAFNQDEAGVFVDYGDKIAAAIRAIVEELSDENGLILEKDLLDAATALEG